MTSTNSFIVQLSIIFYRLDILDMYFRIFIIKQVFYNKKYSDVQINAFNLPSLKTAERNLKSLLIGTKLCFSIVN